MGLNTVADEVTADLDLAIAKARESALAFAPDLVLLFGPDHYNGFFNELMPSFCIGTQAEAVGDYGTPAGALNVDAQTAVAMAESLMDSDFDVAVSRRMSVDHGFAQALQMIWGSLETPPVVPVFVNAVAQPGILRVRRCLRLGQAIGRFIAGDARRILLIGSGGLSHEPPVPTLATADEAVRERITVRQHPTQADRDAKTQRVMAAGRALPAGDPAYKQINSDWDRRWMDALRYDRLDDLLSMSEQSIESEAGLSAHESKTWLIARAAMPAGAALQCTFEFYRAIPEYIAGFGALFLQQDPSSNGAMAEATTGRSA